MHAKSHEAPWYKRAVDQHTIEPDSFVFSVPFDSGYSGKNSSVLVTATHALFMDSKGHRAPAAVVGLQFQHESLAKHFINITSAVSFILQYSFFSIIIDGFFNSAPELEAARKLVHLMSWIVIY